MTTANMLLPVPTVGGTLGPQYAVDINSCLSLVDSHDHSTGKGVSITQAGINITGDLALNGFNATLLRSTRYSSQGAVLALGTDLNCAYVVNDDLYFNDGLGNQIRMTQSGGVAGTPGSIAGLVAPASATYIPASTKFVWQSNTNVSATMDIGSLIIRENIAAANGITISSPASLASAYALTLFPSLPATKRQVSVDSSGNLTADVYAAADDAQNYTITATVAGNALTVALKTLAGSDPSATDTAKISFRSSTATSGSFSARTVSAATSVVVSSGSTLGQTSATATYIYVYALDNGGTVELAVSSTLFNDRVVQSTTAEGGAGGADTSSIMYSTTARSSVPVRLIARLTSNQTTAGTWAAVPTAITLMPENKEPVNSVTGADFNYTTLGAIATVSTVTLTTSGRPVEVRIIPDTSNGMQFAASFTSTAATICSSGATLSVRVNGGSNIRFAQCNSSLVSTVIGQAFSWSGSNGCSTILSLSAGTHTIDIRSQTNSGNATVTYTFSGRLYAREL